MLKSILDIDVNDQAFQRFYATFQQYRAAAAQTPQGFVGAQQAAQGTAVTLEGLTALLAAHAEITSHIARNHRQSLEHLEKQKTIWGQISSHARSVGGFMRGGLGFAAGLAGMGALSAVGLWEFFRHAAHEMSSQRRSFLGMGTSFGMMQGMGLNLGPLFNVGGLLGGVSEMLADPSKNSMLMSLGVRQSDTGTTALEFLEAAQRMAKRTPEKMLGSMLQAFPGLGEAGIGIEEMRLMRSLSEKEFHDLIEAVRKDRAEFDNLDSERIKRWMYLGIDMDRLQRTFRYTTIDKLSELSPVLSEIMTEITGWVRGVSQDDVRGWWEGIKEFFGALKAAGRWFVRLVNDPAGTLAEAFQAIWKALQTAFSGGTHRDIPPELGGWAPFQAAPPGKGPHTSLGDIWSWLFGGGSEKPSSRTPMPGGPPATIYGTERVPPQAPPPPALQRPQPPPQSPEGTGEAPGDPWAMGIRYTAPAYRGGRVPPTGTKSDPIYTRLIETADTLDNNAQGGGRSGPIIQVAMTSQAFAPGLSRDGQPRPASPSSSAVPLPPAPALTGPAAGAFSKLEQWGGLPGGMLDAVWAAESGRGRNMRSPAGALGHFQFMPQTWGAYGAGGSPFNLHDSATAATRYLHKLLEEFHGNTAEALAGYNWGEDNVENALRQYGGNWWRHLPAETQGYLMKILPHLRHGQVPSQPNSPQPRALPQPRQPRPYIEVRNNTGGNAYISASQLAA